MINPMMLDVGRHIFDSLQGAGMAPPNPQEMQMIAQRLAGVGQQAQGSPMPPNIGQQMPMQPMAQGGSNGILGTPGLNPMGQMNPQMNSPMLNQPMGAQRGIFGTQGFHTNLLIDPAGQLQQMTFKRSKGTV